jgi:hypothetical protein
MAPDDSVRRRRCRIEKKYDVSEDRGFIQGFDQTLLSSAVSPDIFPDPETTEHRLSTLRNNPLSGMTFPHLCRLLLVEKLHSVDWCRYKARIIGLFLVSLFNSFLSLIEWIYIAGCLRPIFRHVQSSDEQQVPPLFVLGHPRTGTTLLHSLLAQDTDRFATCSTFCAGFPHAFLSFESLGKVMFRSVLSETRPMDSMTLHFDLPQEDELATCLLTGGMYSPYMSLYFMREEREYRPFQTFRDAKPEEVNRWTEVFQWLCTKLSVRSVLEQMKATGRSGKLPSPKRLLLKSPCHTGRIRHLLKLYPNAQFVYVHRHPIEVFLSSAHMANTTYGYMFLQRPGDGDLKEYILRQGEILVEEYISCIDDGLDGMLEKGKNLVEVSFEDLTSNPYDAVKSIYNGLEGLKNIFSESPSATATKTYPAKLKKYCENLKGYQKNQFDAQKLDDELFDEIRRRWKVQFVRYAYSRERS